MGLLLYLSWILLEGMSHEKSKNHYPGFLKEWMLPWNELFHSATLISNILCSSTDIQKCTFSILGHDLLQVNCVFPKYFRNVLAHH